MKKIRITTKTQMCVYCTKPIDKGNGIIVYPHPEWRTEGRWTNGHRHVSCSAGHEETSE